MDIVECSLSGKHLHRLPILLISSHPIATHRQVSAQHKRSSIQTSSSKTSAFGNLILRISRKPSSVMARSARRRAVFRSSSSMLSTLKAGLGERARSDGSGLITMIMSKSWPCLLMCGGGGAGSATDGIGTKSERASQNSL